MANGKANRVVVSHEIGETFLEIHDGNCNRLAVALLSDVDKVALARTLLYDVSIARLHSKRIR